MDPTDIAICEFDSHYPYVDIKREDLMPDYLALARLIEALGISSILVNERDGTMFISHQSWKQNAENFTVYPVGVEPPL